MAHEIRMKFKVSAADVRCVSVDTMSDARM